VAETVGAVDGIFATGGAGCFRAKKKVAATATRIIAAAETRISVVEWDLAGCVGLADADATLAAGPEGSAAGTVATCGGGNCFSVAEIRTLPRGARRSGTLLGVTLLGGTLGGTMPVGAFPGAIGLGFALAETALGGIGLCTTCAGKTGLSATSFASAGIGKSGGATSFVAACVDKTGLAGSSLDATWLGGIWLLSGEAFGAVRRGT
jgi:hypothetical protein